VSLEIRPVRSRTELMRFIRLPWRIYRNDPLWVPPLIWERKTFLNRKKNPFFTHGDAEYFLALRDGRPVGRVTAQIDHDFNEFHGNEWGMFGFFETEDDREVAHALLDAASAWLRERGRDRMVGPMDFTMNDESGLVIEGFDRAPMVKQPYHPPYYRGLIESYGMEKAMDLFMYDLWVHTRETVLPVLWELAEQLEPKHGIKVRHMRKRDLEQEVDRFVDVYNAAWKDNWGFVPIRREEMMHTAKEMKPILDENWMMVAETADGKTAAMALTVPDINQVLKRMNGRLFPFGWAKFLWYRRQITQVRVGFLGVKPEHQHTGVAAGLYAEHYEMAETTPQKGGELGWILENNAAINRGMEAMGATIVKRYRVYERVFS